MKLRNFEFKARIDDPVVVENKLIGINPVFKGVDHQTDTYFKVPEGRLKLREGDIENALIMYSRKNVADAKLSEIILYKYNGDITLKDILLKTLDVLVVVEKERKIYFSGNVKIHIDKVKDLGSFVEVEAIDETGNGEIERLMEQCKWFESFFGVREYDFIAGSYSDMIIEKQKDKGLK